ncbi:MAG: pyridoxamine 5'-phosphate oxidase family protein [Archangiaceae bacterium]|nr:pyridoxamine 5'-phosphate oxidase family protein [Archangiaceae bacterium]
MSPAEVVAFMRRQKHGAVSTLNARGEPQSAVVGYAVSDALELVFDTLGDTRKAQALRVRPACALTMWDEQAKATVQYEGVADEPKGAEFERVKALYLSVFPDGREREKWPGITWFRVRPRWVRHSDFSGDAPVLSVVELQHST